MRRTLSSALIGISLGFILTLASSFLLAGGVFVFVSSFSTIGKFYLEHLSEAQIGLLMLVIWAVIGIVAEYSADLFNKEGWSLLKITLTHYFFMIVIVFPLAILAGWVPLKIDLILTFLVFFSVAYFFIWIVNRMTLRKSIDEINGKLNQKNSEDNL